MTVGEPSYSFNSDGDVIETYATTAAPAPEFTAEQFLQLFTAPEREAIEASTDPTLKDFIIQLEAAGSFTLANSQIVQGVGYIASLGLLTSARASQILNGTPPT